MNKKLYHCLFKEPEGNALLPTCERVVHGISNKFLYATTHMSKSLAFAFDYNSGEIMLNGSVPEENIEYALVCGGQKTLDKQRYIRVHEFSDNNFIQTEDQMQWVSTHPLPFNETRIAFETENYHDLMENGLHIFLIEEDQDTLITQGFHETYERENPENILTDLAQEKRIRWINQEQGIGMDTSWAKALIQKISHVKLLNPHSRQTLVNE